VSTPHNLSRPPAAAGPETRAWRSRPFRWLWTGGAVSTFGTEVSELALPLLALLTLSASAAELGVLRTAQFLPYLLATLPIGLVVDRCLRRPLMIVADLGRFALVALIPLSVWLGYESMGLLYAVVFAAGVLTVLYQMSDFAFVPSVVTVHQLADANAKVAATQSAMEIGGRGFGGVLVQTLTAPVAIAVDAASYLVSALCLGRVRVPEPVPASAARSPLREAVEGFRVAVGNPYLRALLAGATTFNLFTEVFMIGVMLYAVHDLGLPAAGIGAILVAGGVGSLVGSWFGVRLTGRFHYGTVLLVTLAVGNTAPLATTLTGVAGARATWLLGAAFLVMGLGIGISNAHAVTIRQVAAAPGLRGRVNAAYRLISWGAVPLGALLGGFVATRAGAWAAMVTGAAGLATATLWVAISPVRTLRTAADAASAASGADAATGGRSR
jgi:predicted MFS family arabinose efflux permease